MSAPLFRSSGDLTADRRYDFARDLELRGDLIAAEDLMTQAVELAPRFASAWFALGELRLGLNQHGAAIAAFRQAAACDPQDHHGAHLRLMRLGVEPPAEMSRGYVESLFDQYAPKFEAALRGDLHYRGPEIIRDAVIAACHATGRRAHFAAMVDLGCGTGLAARTLQPLCDCMTGVDVSSRMIAIARTTGLYRDLRVGDMTESLHTMADASADLIVAADAFVYVCDLAPVLAEAHRVLGRSGLLAFTIESHDGEGVILGESLRFRHGKAALSQALASSGFHVVSIANAVVRTEAGTPVPGLVVAAAR